MTKRLIAITIIVLISTIAFCGENYLNNVSFYISLTEDLVVDPIEKPVIESYDMSEEPTIEPEVKPVKLLEPSSDFKIEPAELLEPNLNQEIKPVEPKKPIIEEEPSLHDKEPKLP